MDIKSFRSSTDPHTSGKFDIQGGKILCLTRNRNNNSVDDRLSMYHHIEVTKIEMTKQAVNLNFKFEFRNHCMSLPICSLTDSDKMLLWGLTESNCLLHSINDLCILLMSNNRTIIIHQINKSAKRHRGSMSLDLHYRIG